MILTEKNFCKNIKDVSDSMRTTYVCKKTGKVCPKVDYSSGKALPSKYFVKSGCPLIEDEAIQEVEEVKEAPKKEIIEEIFDNKVDFVNEVFEEVVEEIIEQPTEEVVKEQVVKVEQPKQTQPRTNTSNRKRKSNNNKKK